MQVSNVQTYCRNWRAAYKLSPEDKRPQSRRSVPYAETFITKIKNLYSSRAALPVLASRFFSVMVPSGFFLQPHSTPCTPYHWTQSPQTANCTATLPPQCLWLWLISKGEPLFILYLYIYIYTRTHTYSQNCRPSFWCQRSGREMRERKENACEHIVEECGCGRLPKAYVILMFLWVPEDRMRLDCWGNVRTQMQCEDIEKCHRVHSYCCVWFCIPLQFPVSQAWRLKEFI